MFTSQEGHCLWNIMDSDIQRMGRKIKIRKVSSWSIGITIFVAALFLAISMLSEKEFTILHDTTEQYIQCERAAKQLQDGEVPMKNFPISMKPAFRSIDYVCRIGGDEFSVIMVDVTSCLKYTIEDKIKYVSEELAKVESEVPAVTLSIGVAFSDQENPGESIFKDADKALCHVKENGRNGCAFYNGASSMGSIEGIEK